MEPGCNKNYYQFAMSYSGVKLQVCCKMVSFLVTDFSG